MRHQGAALAVGSLAAPEVARYVARCFGEGALVGRLAPVVYQRTQGHALFLVTMVADLQQRGVVQPGPDGWELAAPLDPTTVDVPETLRHLIAQQFERLSPAEQTVVAAASVAGGEFAAAAVAAGVGAPPEDLDTQCATLARQEQFLRAQGTATWPDGTVTGRYSFIHALYQEVVYARVPVGTRTRVHQQIGARLEQGYGAQARDMAAELAMHFVHGRDTPRALQYLQQAAQNARRRHAHHEVLAHGTRGLALLATLPETPERTRHELALQVLLAPALVATQGYAAPDVERTYSPGARPLSDPGRSAGAVRRAVRASLLACVTRAVSDRAGRGGTGPPHGPAAARSGVARGSARRARGHPGDPRRAGGGLHPPGGRAGPLQPGTAPRPCRRLRPGPCASAACTF